MDDGYSGTDFDRPGFQEMPAEIEADHVAVVLTKDLSRLGRNSTMTGMFINITFAKHGVRYIAINDNFDTQNQNSVDYDFGGMLTAETPRMPRGHVDAGRCGQKVNCPIGAREAGLGRRSLRRTSGRGAYIRADLG